MGTPRRVFVAGSRTFIGQAVCAEVQASGFGDLVGLDDDEPNLHCAERVAAFMAATRPDDVLLVGGLSGGILMNQNQPADLMLDTLRIACAVIPAAAQAGVRKLLYLGSSCSYPRDGAQPMSEEQLFGGPVEPTSSAYALAKLAGIRLCQAYRRQYGLSSIVALPANVFGPGDDFSPENSHVVGALIRRFHEAVERKAAEVTVWGTGAPQRDFIFVSDLAAACIHLLRSYDDDRPINVGTGSGVSIRELAESIAEVTGYPGHLRFDATKPDGAPVKVLDGSRIRATGWRARTDLKTALRLTYEWYKA